MAPQWRLSGKLSCASGTRAAQEAGTRTAHVRHGCGTLWLYLSTQGGDVRPKMAAEATTWMMTAMTTASYEVKMHTC